MDNTKAGARRRQLLAAVSVLGVSLGMADAAHADQNTQKGQHSIKGEGQSSLKLDAQHSVKYGGQTSHKVQSSYKGQSSVKGEAQ